MHPSPDSDERFSQLVLELTMREVLGGLYELSLDVAYAHLDYTVEILLEHPQQDAVPPSAEIIPFPRRRRGAGG
jgi:hypothetical protein